MPLDLFHTGEIMHTHRKCAKCSRFQRCEFAGILTCAGCHIVYYCSKECQRSDWKAHKPGCLAAQDEAKQLSRQSGIQSFLTDLMEWIEFYEAPLKNCALAAYSVQPNFEKSRVFNVKITHKNDMSLPVQKRFVLDNTCMLEHHEIAPLYAACDMSRINRMAKLELGRDHLGSGAIVILAQYRSAVTFKIKAFGIPRQYARIRPVRLDWWNLMREYVVEGAKMKCHCDSLEEMGRQLGVCCCGNFTRHPKDAKTFRDIETGRA